MEDFLKSKGFKVTWKVLLALFLIVIFNPVSCIPSTDRGVKVRFGAVLDGVLKPGLQFKVPLIERIDLYSITPVEVPIQIPVGDNGAITKDNQTVGLSGKIYYRLDESRMDEVARNYTSSGLARIAEANAESSVKSIIGGYTIFDLAQNQVRIAGEGASLMGTNVKQYPINVVDLKITNYNWSKDFDDQIKATMARAQEVKQKDQEVLVVTADAQKQVKQAEAAKQAAILNAEAEKAVTITQAEATRDAAKLAAEAKQLEGEGIRKYNAAIAAGLDIQLQLLKLKIEQTKADKWDGHYVPNNMYGPIPVDTKGGIKGE